MIDFFVHPNISLAQTLNTDFYTSEDIFQKSKEKIFAPSWQFIGNTDLVKNSGDIYPFILLENYLNEPLVLVKDMNGEINLLSNVCTHRGNILIEKACHQTSLRCGYHGRQFSLDGKFLSMPEFKEVKNFPAPEDNLTQLDIYSWGKWMFTALNPKYTASIFLKDMMHRVEWMPMNEFVYRPDLTKEFHIKAHWALYCENYLEGFHIPFVHQDLNSLVDFSSYTTELFYPYSSLQLGLAKNDTECFDLPPSSPDFGKNVAAYYFWVFPNMMFNFYPWGLSVNIVNPTSADTSKVTFISYVWDESKRGKGAGADLDKVEMEDEEIVQNVQRGVRSRFYKHGRYSVTRERGTHHFHRLLSQFIQS